MMTSMIRHIYDKALDRATCELIASDDTGASPGEIIATVARVKAQLLRVSDHPALRAQPAEDWVALVIGLAEQNLRRRAATVDRT